ncbi:MAG TPA: hypothetical protein VJT50_03070 [Pyrinomonadaceae bacterium]|nr:hypothetical protein [Pyrinomonadaceae bacterium]
MKVEYISQPFPPADNALGNQIKRLLTGQDGAFDRFVAIVAFVKFSGVSRLYSALQAFKKSGGESTVIAGIDHRGTTRQGLEGLRQVVDDLYIYHDKSPQRRTFHPKVYVFSNSVDRAVVLIGSGNLTAGGLFSNYESHVRVDFDLNDRNDKTAFDILVAQIDTYRNSSCAEATTDELMERLKKVLPDEATTEKGSAESEERESDARKSAEADPALEGIFDSSKNLLVPPERDIKLEHWRPKKGSSGGVPATAPPQQNAATAPQGFWKVLSNFDVSTTSSPGQIIIPIAFKRWFGPLRQTKEPDAGGKGRQWEISFPAEFTDKKFSRNANARFIVYEPESGHPRTNTECRFTFRDSVIFGRLQAGDILEFSFDEARSPLVMVERYRPNDPQFHTLYKGSGRTYGTL